MVKLKHVTAGLAAGVLAAALCVGGLANAGGHGWGGGGGRGGMPMRGGAYGGMPMRGNAFGGMPMRRTFGGMPMRGPAFGGPGVRGPGALRGPGFYSHAGRSQIGSSNFNRSFPAGRYANGVNRAGASSLRTLSPNISRRTAGLAAIPQRSFAAANLRSLATNRPLQQAMLARNNAFFNGAFAHGRYGYWNNAWRDGWGRWYGYRWWGPVFWPYWFGDYFSYAFWPYDYYDTYWGYGPDAIVWGAFWPYGEYLYDDGYGYDGSYAGDIYRPYRRRPAAGPLPADPAVAVDTSAGGPVPADPAAAVDTCAGFAPGVSDLPVDQLGKIIDATEDQRAAFDDLKSATVKASDILKGSCSAETPLTPVSRLDAMQRRLQAMAEANEVVRTPLVHLYGLFTETQRQRLATLARPNTKRAQAARSKDMNIVELCTSQASFTTVPADQIASMIELNETQKQELEKLKAASAQASESLRSGCPAAVPDTIEGRLDAAQQRVTALVTAIDTVRPAVRDFYASLTDEQKAALSIQPAGKRTSSNRG